MRIAKAHGLGNAFLLVEMGGAPDVYGSWVRRLCDPAIGLGADGLILFDCTDDPPTMRLINSDGSDAEISGNGLRCLAAYLFARGLAPARQVVRTGAGLRALEVARSGNSRFQVLTDFGRPILGSAEIPIAIDPPRSPVLDFPVEVTGATVRVTATSLGNPHCAVFVDSPAEDGMVRELGSALERHPLFPRRTNVEFVTVLSRHELRVRFWERGAGFTRSSGTGAASAAVAAILAGRVERKMQIVCDGGRLEVEWPEGGTVSQKGEVELLFEGEWLPD